MLRLAQYLLLILMLPSALYPQNSQPLNEAEKRQILTQLIELRSARATISAYEAFIKREAELYEQERANWQRAIELEKQATVLAQKERDLAIERAKFFESAYNVASKRPGGFGCTLKKIFTLGLARCK